MSDPTDQELFDHSPFQQEAPKPNIIERCLLEPMTTEGAFTPEECNRILTDLSPAHWDVAKVNRSLNENIAVLSPDVRLSKTHIFDHTPQNEWMFQRLLALTIAANQKEYRFDIDYFNAVQLTRYDVGDFYASHVDIGPGTMGNRKLSMTVQLSAADDYEGGNLLIDFGAQQEFYASRKIGSATVFPSMLRHSVTKVTKGTRYSLVLWVSGTNRFK